ncbi:GNAT family N-acetyltransferase [Methylomonas sp. UP202]|uniref:GNAT family N-acetyltransferase n=1 Tax=Methylomonas sp. UP202 TaxID=3040943 RepID=UPI00247B00A3|nr:GNAT family N-acetyltransferase [Methylomonas sp. UP202]WGS84005.1 GNAT family N-acetyltransferase [Methylomonas sp. UP202]
MNLPLIIRPAEASDAERISQLISSVANCCTISPTGEGAELFFSSISAQAIGGYIANADFLYLLGSFGDTLAGIVAVRDARHLFHLFVGSTFQNEGIGTALALRAIELSQAASPSETFTVNSSLPAVPFYARLGFQPQGPSIEANGVAFVPMQLATADLDYALPQSWL